MSYSIKCETMKIIIVCKDTSINKLENKGECLENTNNNEEDIVKISCEYCKGKDILTTIKMMRDDYGDEINEIVYPNCDILKRVIK